MDKRSNFYPNGEIIAYNLPQSFHKSLRKKMWEKALKGNEKLLIWLSKNELNMKDKIETQSIVEPLPLIIDAKAEEVNGKN